MGCAQGETSLETAGLTALGNPPAESLCARSDEEVVAGNRVLAALGDTPNALLRPVAGRFVGDLEASGVTLPMTLVVDAGLGEFRFTDATWTGEPSDPEAAGCLPVLQVDFAATAVADGWLDTSFSAALMFDENGARFETPVPVDQVEGSVNSGASADDATDLCFNAAFDLDVALWNGWVAWRDGETGSGDELAAEFTVVRVDDAGAY